MESEQRLAKLGAFQQAYPSIDDYRIVVEQDPDGLFGADQALGRRIVYRPANPPPRTIPCDNPKCRNGGLDLTIYLIMAEYAGGMDSRESFFCRGHEGSAVRRGAPCKNRFNATIKIQCRANRRLFPSTRQKASEAGTSPAETELEAARRRMRQAEAQVARQRQIVQRFRAGGNPSGQAEELLKTFERSLQNCQRQLELVNGGAFLAGYPNRSLTEQQISRYKGERRDLLSQIEMMRTKKMKTRSNRIDTTADSILLARKRLAEVEAALAKLGGGLD